MDALKKIVWAEGVVLTQQHFQQWDAAQDRLHPLWHKLFNAFPWGIESTSWNTDSLTSFQLEMTEFKGVFPGGRLVHLLQEDNEPVRLNFEGLNDTRAKVFVAMPGNALVSGITGYEQPQTACAWQASYQQVADQYDGQRSEELLYAIPSLKLLTENELKDDDLSFPVGQLVRQDDGQYAFDSSWQPCLIRVGGESKIYSLLCGLQQRLLHRVSQYREKRQRLGDLTSFSSVELAAFMLQKDLSVCLNELTSLLEEAEGHPYNFFLLLNRLLAQLRLYAGHFAEDHQYQHEDQISSLGEQIDEVTELLGKLSYEQDVTLKLVANDLGILVAEDTNINDFSGMDFYLSIRKPGMDGDDLNNFPDFCKVASAVDINDLIESALPGLALRYCKRIPGKIRQKSGYEYFAIEKNGSLWQKVVQERSLAFFCTGEFTDAEVELLAVTSE